MSNKKTNLLKVNSELVEEIISNTKNAVESSNELLEGSDTVTIMLNGKSFKLSSQDYNKLKEKNNSSKLKIKENIKIFINELKQNLKIKDVLNIKDNATLPS